MTIDRFVWKLFQKQFFQFFLVGHICPDKLESVKLDALNPWIVSDLCDYLKLNNS